MELNGDTHDMKSRALLALVMADGNAVERFTTDFDGTTAYAEGWLLEQGHDAEKAAWLALYLQDSVAGMSPVGAAREAVEDRRDPKRTNE